MEAIMRARRMGWLAMLVMGAMLAGLLAYGALSSVSLVTGNDTPQLTEDCADGAGVDEDGDGLANDEDPDCKPAIINEFGSSVQTITLTRLDGKGKKASCVVTTQKNLEGPVRITEERHEPKFELNSSGDQILDEFGNPKIERDDRGNEIHVGTGQFDQRINEIEIITVTSTCIDRSHGSGTEDPGRHPGRINHVHTSVDTYVVQCSKDAHLNWANCKIGKADHDRPRDDGNGDGPPHDGNGDGNCPPPNDDGSANDDGNCPPPGDNCPDMPDSDQQDSDNDGAGDVCDAEPNDPDIQ